jgi:phage recombination protein Bet
MSTELSKAEQNALSVSYDVLGAHVELDLQFVKKYLVRGKADLVSDQEVVFFINTCKMQGLNPLVQGDVYLIKFSANDPAQIVVGKGGYLRKAFEHPNYLSKLDGITVKRGNEIVMKEGCCIYPGEELIGGWCRVFFERGGKEREAFKEVALSEYNKGQANWTSKPATMINKVAVSQCVREAFPKEYEGVYSEEEMVASGAIPVEYTDIIETPEPEDQTITQEQRQELFKKARTAFKEKANDVLSCIIAEFGLSSTINMPTSVWRDVMARIDTWEEQPSEEDEANP